MSGYWWKKDHKIEEHVCTLPKNPDMLAEILNLKTGGWKKMMKYKLLSHTLAWRYNPRCRLFLTSYSQTYEHIQLHATKYPTVIHPFSKFRVGWEILMLIFYAAVLALKVFCSLNMLTNLSMGEYLDVDLTAAYMLEYFELFQLADILINFNTAYPCCTDHVVYFSKPDIAKAYCRGRLVFDFLSTCPFLLPMSYVMPFNQMGNFLKMLIALSPLKKLLSLRTFLYYYDNIFEVSHDDHTCFEIFGIEFRFVSLCLWLLLVVHWATLGQWIQAALFEIPHSRIDPVHREITNWARLDGYWNHSWADKYSVGIERAAFSIFLHYGVRQTSSKHMIFRLERIIHTALVFAGNLFVADIIAHMLVYLKGRNYSESEYEQQKEELEEHLESLPMNGDWPMDRPLSDKLRESILQSFELEYYDKFFSEENMLSLLDDSLRKDLNVQELNYVSSVMLYEIYLRGEVIFEMGSFANGVYFIKDGMVGIYFNEELKAVLKRGNAFGESVLLNEERDYKAVAMDHCYLYQVPKTVLDEIYRRNPEIKTLVLKIVVAKKRALLFSKMPPKEWTL